MKESTSHMVTRWLQMLNVRQHIPEELAAEFEAFKDIGSIDRIRTSAWIGFVLTLCLFGLDIYRIRSGVFSESDWYTWLLYFHMLGILFLLPALYTTFRRNFIIQTRLRRGIVIWGMVVLTISFLLGQSIITYLQRRELVMFLGYIFIAGWMFSMSHKERFVFNLFSISIMTMVIIFDKNPEMNMNTRVTNFVEIFFLSITAFFFDAYDFNLKWANFMGKRELESEQQRIRQLEEFKSRFFTNLTHELRTPLTIISGMASEIKQDSQRWAQEGSEIIIRNAGNLLNLVNQILALSKIESGAMGLNMTQGEIVSYLGYIVDAYKGHALAKRIKLHYLADEHEIMMDYDPEKYKVILSNLLSNAIKFTPEDGNVYVALDLRKAGGENSIELTVRDTGIGIPQHELEHIFERFYQVQNELTTSGIGTGIGLSLVYEFVKMLGGDIQVKSAPGKGATFTVTLPVHQHEAVERNPFSREGIKSNINFYLPPVDIKDAPVVQEEIDDKPEILIIDDNDDVVKYLQICFGDIYHVTCCRDGQAGMDKAIEIVPDLVISDVLMPVKDGLALCKELKTNPVTSHIPIILLSAKVDPESRIAGLESGADVYMLKPFDKQELLAQVHNLLERREELHARYRNPLFGAPEPGQDAQLPEDKFVARVREAVMDHLDDSAFSVTQLCRAVLLSRTQLHKKLKALTGLSATLFIRKARLMKAMELLKTTDLMITEIAYHVGFTDPNYFTRCFVQEFGETPSETRNKQIINKI